MLSRNARRASEPRSEHGVGRAEAQGPTRQARGRGEALPPNITPTPGPRGSEVSHANRYTISYWDSGGWVTTRNSPHERYYSGKP